MSARIEELKERQAKELADAIKLEDATTRIMEALGQPEGAKVSPHVAYADYVVTLAPVETLTDAIVTAERANPLAIFKVKCGSCAFIPEASLDAYLENHNGATEECIGAYTYEITGLKEYKEEKTLIFFQEVVGFVVKFKVPVQNDPDTYRTWNRNRRVNLEEGLVNKSGHFRRSVRWASGGREYLSTYTLY